MDKKEFKRKAKRRGIPDFLYNINGNGAFEVLNSFDIQIANVKANVKYVLNTTTNLLAYYNEKPTISSITYDNSRVVLSSSTNIITPTKSGYIAIRTNSLKGVKLEECIIPTPYSTYGQGNINVEMCNKNLLNTEIIPVASAGIKTVEFSKDVLTVTSLAKSGYHYLLLNIGSVKKYDGKNLTISAKSYLLPQQE